MRTELQYFLLHCVKKMSDLLLPETRKIPLVSSLSQREICIKNPRLVLSEPRQACQASELMIVKIKWGYGIHTNHCSVPISGLFFHLCGFLLCLGDLISSMYLFLNASEN